MVKRQGCSEHVLTIAPLCARYLLAVGQVIEVVRQVSNRPAHPQNASTSLLWDPCNFLIRTLIHHAGKACLQCIRLSTTKRQKHERQKKRHTAKDSSWHLGSKICSILRLDLDHSQKKIGTKGRLQVLHRLPMVFQPDATLTNDLSGKIRHVTPTAGQPRVADLHLTREICRLGSCPSFAKIAWHGRPIDPIFSFENSWMVIPNLGSLSAIIAKLRKK